MSQELPYVVRGLQDERAYGFVTLPFDIGHNNSIIKDSECNASEYILEIVSNSLRTLGLLYILHQHPAQNPNKRLGYPRWCLGVGPDLVLATVARKLDPVATHISPVGEPQSWHGPETCHLFRS